MTDSTHSNCIPILNPYEDLFLNLHHLLSSRPLPERRASIRRKLVSAYSWAIPSREALDSIVALELPILELGAGTGYWAFCLRQLGARVHAYDQNAHAPPHWSPVEQGESLAVLEQKNGFPEGALLLCWPPLGDPMAIESLQRFRGPFVIEIGEEAGGNTGTRSFADELERSWKLETQIDLPRWPNASDSLRIWSRKPERQP